MSQLPIPPEFRPPQAKLPGPARVRAYYRPERLPVPFQILRAAVYNRPDFAPTPPPRGYWLYSEIPPVKIRGLSPTDSLILRLAIADRLIDPSSLYLACLVPYTPPTPGPLQVVTRSLLTCPDAPGQTDAIIPRPKPPPIPPWEWMPKPEFPIKQPPPPEPWPDHWEKLAPPPADAARLPGPIWIIEIKPNAGYVALGQVLTYVWNWNRHYGRRWPAQPCILTDLARPYLLEMAPDFGLNIIQLNRIAAEPPPYPT